MTIFGVDVSEHQNGMSLAQARREGAEFAFIRTTDGTHRDSCYRSHLDDAEGAGMITAAYHFCRRPNEGTSVAAQVDASLAVMGDARRPVWLDVETPGGFTGQLVGEFQAEFERRGVRVVGAYSYVPYWEGSMIGGEPDSHQYGSFWVAGYPTTQGGTPAQIYSAVGGDGARQWSHPLGNQLPKIWQFTDRATVAGHQVDANAFRGSADELRSLITGGSTATSQEDDMTPEQSQKLDEIHYQLLNKWPQLGNLTLVDAVSRLCDQVFGPGKTPTGDWSYTGWPFLGDKTPVDAIGTIQKHLTEITTAVKALTDRTQKP